ncbi:hypothetical protein C0V97_17905, partial [Asaia sp. W19]|uniref:hypothetical protein n=2 Tax=Asaia TaxID=91914 RepID=UPI001001A100
NDPQKSSAFALNLLKAKADHAGLSFDNPDDYASILRLHNGGGDPNYVQHVAARIPSTPPETALSGPAEGTQMSGSMTQPPPGQVAFQGPQPTQDMLDAADPHSSRTLSQMLLRAGAGFAGGRTFGEGLSGALAGAADTLDQQQQAAYELYRQQQLQSLYGLKADTTNANNETKVGVAGARNATSARNTDVRAGVAERGQDIGHGDRQDAINSRQNYQNAALALRGQIANSRGAQAAALTGAPYTPVTIPQNIGQAPAGVPQSPPAPPPPGVPSTPPATPPQPAPLAPPTLPPAPTTDPWALPPLPTQGGIRGAQQFAQKNQGERDRYARDHASALTDDQALLNNLDQYQGAYDRLQSTALSKPGMGASWRIPLASVLSGNGLGNADAAELNKQHNTLTAQLAGAKGRVLVAGLKIAGASLPDQSVPYQAGNAILQSTAANTRLQQAVDQARATLLQRNPNATPAQIESALGEYVQGVGSPFTTGSDGSVTPRDIPSFEQWKAGGHADPEAAEAVSKAFPKAPAITAPQAAIDYLRNNPQFSDAFDQKYGKGAAAATPGK